MYSDDMKYERVTKRTVNNGVQYSVGKYLITCYPQNENCLSDVEKMAIRLAEFEDGIENKTIIRLPCKIGSSVFVKMQSGEIVEEKVSSITITGRNIIIGYYEHYGYSNARRLPLRIRILGKDCFLKREEVK